MPNKNGSVYGLTILSPIIDDEKATPSHDLQIRKYLATLPTEEESPFALAPGTHLARLVVMDDVIYVGMPACEEHLKSKYLVFESNCDGDLDTYLSGLADQHTCATRRHLEALCRLSRRGKPAGIHRLHESLSARYHFLLCSRQR